MKDTATTFVRVRLLVEVDLGSTWGADCSVGQVRAQATREATEMLQRRLAKEGGRPIKIVELAGLDVIVRSDK